MAHRVSVVAAVITPAQAASLPDEAHRPLQPETPVLLSQRRPGKHLAGFWEFPGGRIEPGERAHEALARELQEELGIIIQSSQPWCALTHHYPDKTVHLSIHRVTDFTGAPTGCEGQSIEWVEWAQVPHRTMPPADQALLKVFGMAPQVWMGSTEDAPADSVEALRQWRNALSKIEHTPWAGNGWWLVWPSAAQGDGALAQQAMALARKAGHQPLVAGSPRVAQAVGASGVVLDQATALTLTQRPPHMDWVAVACRDDVGLAEATRLDADFALLMPQSDPQGVASRSGSSPRTLEALIQKAGVPVMVVGDLACNDLASARRRGAFGVAGIHSQWG